MPRIFQQRQVKKKGRRIRTQVCSVSRTYKNSWLLQIPHTIETKQYTGHDGLNPAIQWVVVKSLCLTNINHFMGWCLSTMTSEPMQIQHAMRSPPTGNTWMRWLQVFMSSVPWQVTQNHSTQCVVVTTLVGTTGHYFRGWCLCIASNDKQSAVPGSMT